MSLVGDIEDLGFGEILQIVSLSRRSGVLSLESRGRNARIIFQNGHVTRASSTTFREHLGEVLVHKGIIDPAILKGALSIQADEDFRQLMGTIMVERFQVSGEAIEAVVTEQIEKVVYSLFTWTRGTFKFEIQEVAEVDAARMDPVQFMLQQGLNPQFLAMEGSRIIDEMRHRGELDEEPEAAAAPGPALDSDFGLAPPKPAVSPKPAPAPLREERFEMAEPSPYSAHSSTEAVGVTARLIMAVGGAVLLYGVAGLVRYYNGDWQAALPDPDLVPVSKISIFFRFGFIPWAVTLFSLYMVWAGHQFWKVRRNSLRRLTECAWSGIAVAVIYEVAEFCNWLRLASSTPHLSYYAVGVAGLLFWAALLSAPFAALLLYLNSEGISREFRKMSHLNSVSDQLSGN